MTREIATRGPWYAPCVEYQTDSVLGRDGHHDSKKTTPLVLAAVGCSHGNFALGDVDRADNARGPRGKGRATADSTAVAGASQRGIVQPVG